MAVPAIPATSAAMERLRTSDFIMHSPVFFGRRLWLTNAGGTQVCARFRWRKSFNDNYLT
jgi:hypothetical protein